VAKFAFIIIIIIIIIINPHDATSQKMAFFINSNNLIQIICKHTHRVGSKEELFVDTVVRYHELRVLHFAFLFSMCNLGTDNSYYITYNL
jgi:hypothetical protein